MFYIASLWWWIAHWCKETHLIYRKGRHIYLLVITLILLGPLLWYFAVEFLSKILFKQYRDWLCSWVSTFWSCDGELTLEKSDFKHHTKCAFMKVLWSFFDEKISPSPMTGKIVTSTTIVTFWMTSYMPQSQQKRGLKDWREAEIPLYYGQTY